MIIFKAYEKLFKLFNMFDKIHEKRKEPSLPIVYWNAFH